MITDNTTVTAAQLGQAIDQLQALGATVRRPFDPYPNPWAVTWPGDRMEYGFRSAARLVEYARLIHQAQG